MGDGRTIDNLIISMRNNNKLKSEKRQEQAAKMEIKRKKGGTLAGQISRTRTARKYKGSGKKMIKL